MSYSLHPLLAPKPIPERSATRRHICWDDKNGTPMTADQLMHFNLEPRYGRLRILGLNRSSKAGLVWDVLCDCGQITTALGVAMRRGHKKSCGCMRGENLNP